MSNCPVASLANQIRTSLGVSTKYLTEKKVFHLISVRTKEYLVPSFLYEMTL